MSDDNMPVFIKNYIEQCEWLGTETTKVLKEYWSADTKIQGKMDIGEEVTHNEIDKLEQLLDRLIELENRCQFEMRNEDKIRKKIDDL